MADSRLADSGAAHADIKELTIDFVQTLTHVEALPDTVAGACECPWECWCP